MQIAQQVILFILAFIRASGMSSVKTRTFIKDDRSETAGHNVRRCIFRSGSFKSIEVVV